MKSFFNYLIRKPTVISILSILFLIVYKQFSPPKSGSAYNMILETLIIVSIVPLGLYMLDRLLVTKINHIKLAITEAVILGSFFTYYFLVVNPF